MRLVSLTSPALLIALSLLPFPARAQSDDELTEEELAAAEAEAEAEAKAEEEAKAKESAPPAGAAPAEPASEAEVEEAAPADLEGMFEPGQEPFRKPPKGKGVIWGRLVDEKTGEPAIEAQITVKGTKYKALTDFDGYYRLEVPPGTYTIEVFYELHEPASISGVSAAKDKVSRFDAPLKPQGGALEEVVIQDEAEKQTVAGLAIARQRSASQGDAIGRAEITRTGDSNAAQAAKRVVGANIVGGRFVYVRGLGERYSNSLLGGFPLPSPEPDRSAVPLDVFPANVLDSLTIAKTFTPDMPGDFAGGSVQIETRSVPEKPFLNIQLTGGINTQSTFKQRLDFADSGTDFLGFDSGMRALPNGIPTDRSLADGGQSNQEIVDAGVAVNSPITARLKESPFNHGLSVVGGNTWTFANGQKLGVLASLTYARAFERQDQAILREFQPTGGETDIGRELGYEPRIDYRVDRGIETVKAGLFGKVSYLFAANHKVTVSGIHSQLSDDTTMYAEGRSFDNFNRFSSIQNSWVERGMSFGVLSGRHTFEGLNKAELSWDAALSRATRNEPDRRDAVFFLNTNIRNPENRRERLTGWTYANSSESGRHLWTDQVEDGRGGKVDWRQPITTGDTEVAVKFGGLLNLKERNFAARRFLLRPTTGQGNLAYSCLGETFQLNCPEQLLTEDAIRGTNPENTAYFRLEEGSRPGDGYAARLNVYAGYLMGDFEFNKKLRVVAGARVEVTEQAIEPRLPPTTNIDTSIPGANINAADFLPSLSLVHNISKEFKGRYSYARTLARPQLRELAPFGFADYFGGRIIAGNPNLTLTTIDNFDTRFEFWPSVSDVLAFSAFYKALQDPIETILTATSDQPQLSYANSPNANLVGGEFEVRKNLGFLTPVLDDFSVVGNFTLTYSRVEIPRDTPATSFSRTLVNQAPWVFNAALDYENDIGTGARISYNVTGVTLVEVGTLGIPDAYLQSQHFVDLTVSQKFLEKFTGRLVVTNIANTPYVVSQGKDVIVREVDGQDQEINVMRKYTTGTLASVTLGYEF